MFGIGWPEMVIIGFLAVLLFGKKVPEVARSLGKGMMEFKKGLRGVEEEIYSASNTTTSPKKTQRYNDVDDRDEATAPRFEPPPTPPVAPAS
jgi:sec-independent protein translocase protein TatA